MEQIDNTVPEAVETNQEVSVEAETQETNTNEQPEQKQKPAETLEARRARLARQLEQIDKKLGTPKVEQPTQTNGLDNGTKAYLVANGIKGTEEFGFFQKWAERTGEDIDAIIEDDIFQAKLKSLRDNKASKLASSVSSTKRSQSSARDSVDYWIAKGELPPEDMRDLRFKVVAEKRKRAAQAF